MTFETIETKPDGLYLPAGVPLQQLAADDSLRDFADGLVPRTVAATLPAGAQPVSLSELLHSPDPVFGGILAALLALDAEVIATIDGDRRSWPLPGFLSYRARLVSYQPELVRLPPLNPDGHYLLVAESDRAFVLRFDMHPGLRVLGHIRIATIVDANSPPQRVTTLEHRLERRTLTAQLLAEIQTAGSTGDLQVDQSILKRLISLLQEFAGENG